MSYSDYLENKINDAVCKNVPLSVANRFAKLHTGDPGENGTANAAGETARKALTFGDSSGGTSLTDADATWVNVAATETYSHISLWDSAGPAGGNCLGSGALTVAKAVTAGDTFVLSAGDVSFTSN